MILGRLVKTCGASHHTYCHPAPGHPSLWVIWELPKSRLERTLNLWAFVSVGRTLSLGYCSCTSVGLVGSPIVPVLERWSWTSAMKHCHTMIKKNTAIRRGRGWSIKNDAFSHGLWFVKLGLRIRSLSFHWWDQRQYCGICPHMTISSCRSWAHRESVWV